MRSSGQFGAPVGRVLQFFKPYRLRVALTIGAIIVVALIGLVNPLLLKLIIDKAIPNKGLSRLYLYVGLMIALPILSGLIGVGQTWLDILIGQNVMRDLRNALYAHLQRMPLRFFASTRTGEIQARLSSYVSGVQQVVTDTATSIVSNLATAISTIVAMWLLADDADLPWAAADFSLPDLPRGRDPATCPDGDAGNRGGYGLPGGGDAVGQLSRSSAGTQR